MKKYRTSELKWKLFLVYSFPIISCMPIFIQNIKYLSGIVMISSRTIENKTDKTSCFIEVTFCRETANIK